MQILPDRTHPIEHPAWCSSVACADDSTITEHRSFPTLIASLSIAKPTLEDIFIRLTGHRLGAD